LKSVLCDADFFLDIFLKREPYYAPAAKLFTRIEQKKVEGYISAISFPVLFNLLAEEIGPGKASITLSKLRILFKVAQIDEKIIDLSLASNFKDFEDAVEYYTLIQSPAVCLISRNKSGYLNKKIPILSPEEFLALQH
jgi:predicted nucleic acid-binding protein